MPKPIILITAGKQNPATPRAERQSVFSGSNMDYIRAVVRAGGAPVLLPCMDDEDAVRSAVAAADGLLLTGGGDVVSLAYGEEPHPLSKYQDPTRDAMEFAATRAALERDLPILGICRGIQLLNVALGGTLIQDIPTQVPGACKHYAEVVDTTLLHTVAVEPDTRLARLFPVASMGVNSYHHQAIKDLGRGLKVNCRARDGVIEGAEAADDRAILAVQFHPEECAVPYPQFQTLFDWLIEKASEQAAVGLNK